MIQNSTANILVYGTKKSFCLSHQKTTNVYYNSDNVCFISSLKNGELLYIEHNGWYQRVYVYVPEVTVFIQLKQFNIIDAICKLMPDTEGF